MVGVGISQGSNLVHLRPFPNQNQQGSAQDRLFFPYVYAGGGGGQSGVGEWVNVWVWLEDWRDTSCHRFSIV